MSDFEILTPDDQTFVEQIRVMAGNMPSLVPDVQAQNKEAIDMLTNKIEDLDVLTRALANRYNDLNTTLKERDDKMDTRISDILSVVKNATIQSERNAKARHEEVLSSIARCLSKERGMRMHEEMTKVVAGVITTADAQHMQNELKALIANFMPSDIPPALQPAEDADIIVAKGNAQGKLYRFADCYYVTATMQIMCDAATLSFTGQMYITARTMLMNGKVKDMERQDTKLPTRGLASCGISGTFALTKKALSYGPSVLTAPMREFAGDVTAMILLTPIARYETRLELFIHPPKASSATGGRV